MNVLWSIAPKLLSAYDRYVVRRLISRFAYEIYSEIENREDTSWCKYSNAETWILAACVAFYAYDRSRNGRTTSGAGGIWPDLAVSLLKRYGERALTEETANTKWETGGAFFQWFGEKVQHRFPQYSDALSNDIESTENNPNFWSGELKLRVLENLFIRVNETHQQSYDLLAYEISYNLLSQLPTALEVLSNPSLRRLALARFSDLVEDSFWIDLPSSALSEHRS